MRFAEKGEQVVARQELEVKVSAERGATSTSTSTGTSTSSTTSIVPPIQMRLAQTREQQVTRLELKGSFSQKGGYKYCTSTSISTSTRLLLVSWSQFRFDLQRKASSRLRLHKERLC